jgi:hypothetical protein
VKKIITGTFKGEDGSLGYRTGKFYALCVEENPSRLQQILNRWPRGLGNDNYKTNLLPLQQPGQVRSELGN